jgi:hypothetical protein
MLGKSKQVPVQKNMAGGPNLEKRTNHLFKKWDMVKIAISGNYLCFTEKSTMVCFSTYLKLKTINSKHSEKDLKLVKPAKWNIY